MSFMRFVGLSISHLAFAGAGFAGGIYALPILIAPDSPTVEAVDAVAANAQFKGEFKRELAGSDALHWGEGSVAISSTAISHMGELAPGPDYKLYLSPEFVETEEEFEKLKSKMARVGDVKTFTNFVVDVPSSIDVSQYNTVVIWCEAFGEFITATTYQ
ncbi:MAG: DM13 domain-containing protein [Burkholderiaceae bacterium]